MNIAFSTAPRLKANSPVQEIAVQPQPTPIPLRPLSALVVKPFSALQRIGLPMVTPPEEWNRINEWVQYVGSNWGLSAQEKEDLMASLSSHPGQSLDAEIDMLDRMIQWKAPWLITDSDRNHAHSVVAGYTHLLGLRQWKPERISPYIVETLTQYAVESTSWQASVSIAQILANTTADAYRVLVPWVGDDYAMFMMERFRNDLMGRGEQTPSSAAAYIADVMKKRY
jgi:hypothetical protein